MSKVKIKTKLTIDDYIKANYYLSYRKWLMKLFPVIGLIVLLSIPLYPSDKFPLTEVIVGFMFTIGLPLLIYFNSKKQYSATSRLSETVYYEFDDVNVYVQGESFNATLSWDKIHAVEESKNLIFIWQNTRVANIIPKREVTPETFKAFAEIVSKQTSLKNRLREMSSSN